MTARVVITGIGMVTPLGRLAEEVLTGIRSKRTAAVRPNFETDAFDCPVCACVRDFDAEQYFPGNKTLRLMNRDAQMAVVAARLAMADADIESGETYPSEDIGLFGATGMATMSAEDIAHVIKYAANNDGSFSLERFGRVALRRIRPILSFRILANMPICFVSLCEDIRGPNAVYTPWEGQGAQAISAGIRAIKRGDVPCALVGGCDVKCRELSFLSLQQLGVFAPWRQFGTGCIPAEGAAFIVIEEETAAAKRGRQPYAFIKDHIVASVSGASPPADTIHAMVSRVNGLDTAPIIVGAGDGDPQVEAWETQAFARARLEYRDLLRPKAHVGDLFAAAAFVQVGLAAQLARVQDYGQNVMAHCFGYGTEKAVFVVEAM